MDKKMYIVRGSEDGTLGVYSNLKRAYAKAIKYNEYIKESDIKSYAKVCKQFNEHKDYWSWEVNVDNNYHNIGGASIMLFYVNKGRNGEG
tara:strand:- start:235 stop:504 length:270 start_codon:yes stop_codon:yes gene_type:complete